MLPLRNGFSASGHIVTACSEQLGMGAFGAVETVEIVIGLK